MEPSYVPPVHQSKISRQEILEQEHRYLKETFDFHDVNRPLEVLNQIMGIIYFVDYLLNYLEGSK